MPRGKPYSKAFKLEAIGRALEGTRSDAEVARELGISVGAALEMEKRLPRREPKGDGTAGAAAGDGVEAAAAGGRSSSSGA